MKTFKSTPRLHTKLNYLRCQQSDIFRLKGLNKPEYEYKHKKKFIDTNIFKSTYDFLDYNEMSPHLDSSIKMKQNPNYLSQILNSNTSKYIKRNKTSRGRPILIKMYEEEPDLKRNKSERHLNVRYQKETLDLGNYEGNEYKVKKNRSVIYDPSPYFKEKSPLKRKMDFIYGGCEDLIYNYKPAIYRNKKIVRSASATSIGFCRRDFETRNEYVLYDPKIRDDPKKMKYFWIYGNKGIENANKKLKSLRTSRSTSNMYVMGEDPFINKVNFYKSNIFNDKDVEKINNNLFSGDYEQLKNKAIRVNRKIRPKRLRKRSKSSNLLTVKKLKDVDLNNIDITNNHNRRGLYNANEEKLPVKVDWRDAKFYLLFPQNKNKDILKKTARQRKFKNVFGTDPILPKKKLGQEFTYNGRPKIDEAAKNNYKNSIKYSRMKKISENISQMQGNKFINDNNVNIKNRNMKNNYKNNRPNPLTFEIKTRSKKKFMSNHEIEKAFANKGIHIYDLKEDMGTVLNCKDFNKVELKVRDNNDKDNGLDIKIDNIKEDFKKKGFLMKEKKGKRRDSINLSQKTSRRNSTQNTISGISGNVSKRTSTIIVDKIDDRKYNLKPPIRQRNKEEKITRIYVNLKHKARPNHV